MLFFGAVAQDSTSVMPGPTLDHSVLIEQLNGGRKVHFNALLQLFDEHLASYPDDVAIHIERCLFLESALYDSYEEYNPMQDESDACQAWLAERFPEHPAVLLMRLQRSWGDERGILLDDALNAFDSAPAEWSNAQSAVLLRTAADHHHGTDDELALDMLVRAMAFDQSERGSLLHGRILIDLGRDEEAREVLNSVTDTAKGSWDLQERGRLLLRLNDAENAKRLFDVANGLSEGGHGNSELAAILEELGDHAGARAQLVSDTANLWLRRKTLLSLFLFDLRHLPADTALASYNAFRLQDYANDPLALHRLRLFAKAPTLSWEWRDLFGLGALLMVLLGIVWFPSVWILPVYVAGHRWTRLNGVPVPGAQWGLKAFWWASSAALLATLATLVAEPESLQQWMDDTFDGEFDTSDVGRSVLVFLCAMAILSIPLLRGAQARLFGTHTWSLGMSIGITIASLTVFKMAAGTYMSLEHVLTDMGSLLSNTGWTRPAASQEEILAFVETYGIGMSFLFLTLLVPLYEELIFRGVILASVTRHIGSMPANLVQAMLFGAIHGDLFLFPYFVAFGLITGVLTQRSGSLLPGILFHILNNALSIAMIARGAGS
jgi:membrane protease YdiL (CAAX protease family)/tetratricopeptide (TPR) repeat protein